MMSSVSEQIMRTVIAGKTRGTILFSAQQFKSATDYRLQENTDLHITAKNWDYRNYLQSLIQCLMKVQK
jgi:hypothetical protein